MIALAALAGYVIGSLPTAGWIAGAFGIDLRSTGSQNPGANNAMRLGGKRLAAVILIVEIVKGATAVTLGVSIAGDIGGAVAGMGALTGNVLNLWYRLSGGQGLGITAGVLLAAWPIGFLIAFVTIAAAVAVTRSTAKAALVALVALGAGLAFQGLPDPWGLEPSALVVLVVGVVVLVAPKQILKLRLQKVPA